MTRLLAIVACIMLGVVLHHQVYPSPQIQDVYRASTLPENLNHCDCGPDLETAEARGCIYDSLATAWLPPHCRDDELTAKFDCAGPGVDGAWPYFADPNGTVPINKHQISLLGFTNGTFWSSRDWHIAHCVFYWKKTVRMRDTGAVMEERVDQLMHVHHCGRLIMKPRPEGLVLLEVDVRTNSAKT
jgi:hypothetical protein